MDARRQREEPSHIFRWPMAGLRWVFDSFELVPSVGELRKSGAPVRIGPKPFRMLCELVRQRSRVVPHEELREVIWSGVQVSDAAYFSVVRDLRRALGDDGRESRFIATLRGRGLRFVADVLELPESPPESEETADAAAGRSRPWRDDATRFEEALASLDRLHASRGTPKAIAERERSEILLALARARWAAGATGEARAAFLEAGRAARRCGDAETLGRAALGFAGRTDVTPGVRREAVLLLEEALDGLDETAAPTLRSELLARLGTELYHEGDGTRGHRLTARAVELAEASGDGSALAYALTALHFVQQRPDFHPRERIGLADRAIALVEDQPPSDVLALAHQERLLDLLELGEGAAYAAACARYDALVDRLEQPFFAWIRELFRANRALLAGELEDAERRAVAALGLGREIGTPNALAAFAAQLFAVRLEQRRLPELLPLLLAEARARRAHPILRAAALAIAAEGEGRDVEAELRDVVAELAESARDHHWPAALALLAAAAAAHRDVAERLRELLEPFADRLIVVGYGAATLGAFAHTLARLDAALGDVAAARSRLRSAESLYVAMGAVPWLERVRRDRRSIAPA